MNAGETLKQEDGIRKGQNSGYQLKNTEPQPAGMSQKHFVPLDQQEEKSIERSVEENNKRIKKTHN
jgi:hypothetical protein